MLKPKDLKKPIPEQVFAVFDRLIKKHWNQPEAGKAKIYHNTAYQALLDAGITKQEIELGEYMDIEPMYRKNGWDVYYKKPDYTETWEPYYIFQKKKKLVS